MREISIPSGVRVTHRASACATSTPFSPQWFGDSPIPYSWNQSSWVQIQSDPDLRLKSERHDMPKRLVCPTSTVTIVRWMSGGVRTHALTRYERLKG